MMNSPALEHLLFMAARPIKRSLDVATLPALVTGATGHTKDRQADFGRHGEGNCKCRSTTYECAVGKTWDQKFEQLNFVATTTCFMKISA